MVHVAYKKYNVKLCLLVWSMAGVLDVQCPVGCCLHTGQHQKEFWDFTQRRLAHLILPRDSRQLLPTILLSCQCNRVTSTYYDFLSVVAQGERDVGTTYLSAILQLSVTRLNLIKYGSIESVDVKDIIATTIQLLLSCLA